LEADEDKEEKVGDCCELVLELGLFSTGTEGVDVADTGDDES
jgi:hypothetical protein